MKLELCQGTDCDTPENIEAFFTDEASPFYASLAFTHTIINPDFETEKKHQKLWDPDERLFFRIDPKQQIESTLYVREVHYHSTPVFIW